MDNNKNSDNFLYLPYSIYTKYHLTPQKPYSINYKLIRHRTQFNSLTTYLKKLENFSKKDQKKPAKAFFCYLKPLPPDFFEINQKLKPLEYQNYIFLPKNLMISLNLSMNLPIKLDFSTKISDFSKHKFCTIRDFINPKAKFHLYIFPISQKSNHNEEILKQDLANYLLTSFLDKQIITFYSGQLIKFNDCFFAVRLLETLPDHKKNLLEMFVFEEKKAEIKISPDELKNITKLAQEKIIISKPQDFYNNFSEKTIVSYNTYVKEYLNKNNVAHTVDFLEIIFWKELEEMQKFIINFIKNTEKQLLCNLNSCLLSGNSGNGKSSLLSKLQKTLKGFNFETIDFNEITTIKHANVPPLDITKGFVEGKIQAACLKDPSVVILDHLEFAAKNIERIDFQQSHEILVSEVFGKFVKDLMKKYRNVVFIVVCENQELLNGQFNGYFLDFIFIYYVF